MIKTTGKEKNYELRGSVSGVTDSEGMIWQSYRYNANGDITFGKPQYNNVYTYNAESYNPNMESQYLRARYYNVTHANFLTEDSYLGNIIDPLTLNRYDYVKSSPMNAINSALDPKAVTLDTIMGGTASALWFQVNAAINKQQAQKCSSNGKGGSGTGKLPDQIEGNSYDINKLQKTQPYADSNKVASIKADILQKGPNSVPPIEIRVDNGRAFVVDGHHRLEAFRQLGYDRVPIKYLHGSQLGKILPDGTYYRTLQELEYAAKLWN